MRLGGTPHETGLVHRRVEVGEARRRRGRSRRRGTARSACGVTHDRWDARGRAAPRWGGRPPRRTIGQRVGPLLVDVLGEQGSQRRLDVGDGGRRGGPAGRRDHRAGRLVAPPRPVPIGDGPLDPPGQRPPSRRRPAPRRRRPAPRRRRGRRAGWRRLPRDHAAPPMRIRALSVFEGVVYHCWCVDPAHPARPTLEVEAVLRPGDADAESGPLLLSIADYIPMAGGMEARGPVPRRAGRQGPHRGAPRRAPHHVPHVDPHRPGGDERRPDHGRLVEAAGAEAGEVEGDPAVARRHAPRRRRPRARRRPVRGRRSGTSIRATSPWCRTRSSAKPRARSARLGPLDRAEPAERDRRAVGQAGRQARRRRLVPGLAARAPSTRPARRPW